MANKCELWVNNQIFGGWTEISIQRGIEQMSGSFSLTVTERWPGQLEARPIQTGDSCVVKIDGVSVVTGYVNRTRQGYSATDTWFSVEGRDKTADLTDCSAIHKSGQWKSASLKQIAADLCRPFGIEVFIGARGEKAAGETITSFALEDSETVQDALQRLLRMKALMMWTDGTGRLVIDLPDQTAAGTALVEGENILSAEGTKDESEQYSQYIVKSQGRGKHDGKGDAADAGVKRYRPLLILAEDQSQSPAARAKHEATMREGKADRAEIKVQSWRQGGDKGELWLPGLRVQVKAVHIHKDDEEMIISEIEYSLNDQEGTVATLQLANPKAYDQLAEQPRQKQGRGRGKRRGGRKRNEPSAKNPAAGGARRT